MAVSSLYLLAHLLSQQYSSVSEDHIPRTFPFIMDYFVDREKYYYLMLAHVYLATFAIALTILNTDALLFLVIEHACGIFDIIG